MQETKYLNVSSPLHPAWPAHFGVLQEQVDRVLNFLVLVGRCQGIVLSDVIELLEATEKGFGKPDEDQTLPLASLGATARKRQAARRWALSAFAASLETHCVDGSSGSSIA